MQRQLRLGGRQMHFDGLWQGPEAAERCMLTGAARREAAGKLPPPPGAVLQALKIWGGGVDESRLPRYRSSPTATGANKVSLAVLFAPKNRLLVWLPWTV